MMVPDVFASFCAPVEMSASFCCNFCARINTPGDYQHL